MKQKKEAPKKGVQAKNEKKPQSEISVKQIKNSQSKAIKKSTDSIQKKAITIKKFDNLTAGKAFTDFKSIHDISVKDIDGKQIKKLGDILKGKKLTMIVNVASRCGLTKSSYTLMS